MAGDGGEGAGHASAPLRADLLNALLDRAAKESRHARRLKLVAASCLDTARTIEPEVIQRVEVALDELIPPRRVGEARSLALAGDRLLRRLPTDLTELTSAQAAACVRAAAMVGGPQAMALLGKYATNPDASVQRQLAEVWRYFPAEAYACEVLAEAPLYSGMVLVRKVDHVPHVRHLRHLTGTEIVLDAGAEIRDLDFLRGTPHLRLLLVTSPADHGLDLAPLAEHQAIRSVHVNGPGWCEAIGSVAHLSLKASAWALRRRWEISTRYAPCQALPTSSSGPVVSCGTSTPSRT